MGTSTKIVLFLLIAATPIISALGQQQHNSETTAAARTGRGRGCSGCPTEVEDPQNNHQIQHVASFAYQTHLESLEDREPGRHLIRIVTAQRQDVMSGLKYILELELGFSNCTNAELAEDAEKHYYYDCPLDPARKSFICNFEVLEQPRPKTHMELIYSQCHLNPEGQNLVLLGSSSNSFEHGGGDVCNTETTTGQSSIYYKSIYPTSWYGALLECERNGSALLDIETETELQEVNKLIFESEGTEPVFWTRGRYDVSSSLFQWGDGSPFGGWAPWTQWSHPKSLSYATRVQMYTVGVPRFRTRDYTDAQRFICEKKVRRSG